MAANFSTKHQYFTVLDSDLPDLAFIWYGTGTVPFIIKSSVAELSHFSSAPAPDIFFPAAAPGKQFRLRLPL